MLGAGLGRAALARCAAAARLPKNARLARMLAFGHAGGAGAVF